MGADDEARAVVPDSQAVTSESLSARLRPRRPLRLRGKGSEASRQCFLDYMHVLEAVPALLIVYAPSLSVHHTFLVVCSQKPTDKMPASVQSWVALYMSDT